jgi:hypothetical protein
MEPRCCGLAASLHRAGFFGGFASVGDAAENDCIEKGFAVVKNLVMGVPAAKAGGAFFFKVRTRQQI